MRLTLIAALFSMMGVTSAHAGDKAKDRNFIQSATQKLADAGIDAKITKPGVPGSIIRIQVKSADDVTKAYKLLASRGNKKGFVNETTLERGKPNLVESNTVKSKGPLFSVGTKHGYATYNFDQLDD